MTSSEDLRRRALGEPAHAELAAELGRIADQARALARALDRIAARLDTPPIRDPRRNGTGL